MKAIVIINDNKVLVSYNGDTFAAIYANHKVALFNGFGILLSYAQDIETLVFIELDN